jgi:hypothetical protein
VWPVWPDTIAFAVAHSVLLLANCGATSFSPLQPCFGCSTCIASGRASWRSIAAPACRDDHERKPAAPAIELMLLVRRKHVVKADGCNRPQIAKEASSADSWTCRRRSAPEVSGASNRSVVAPAPPRSYSELTTTSSRTYPGRIEDKRLHGGVCRSRGRNEGEPWEHRLLTNAAADSRRRSVLVWTVSSSREALPSAPRTRHR